MNTRWLRNHREIARFLKLKGSQKLLRVIGEWIAREDFPRKQKKGFVATEVYGWYLRFAHEQAKIEAPLIAARQIIENKRVPGRRALKELEDRSLNLEEGGPIHGPQSTVLISEPVQSIRHLAVVLTKHFARHITEQRIKNWLNGHLPPGVAERFPPRDPNRYGWNNPGPCFEWVQKHYISEGSPTGVQEELFSKTKREAEMAELNDTINKERKSRMEAETLERSVSDKWILREVARETATRVVNDILHVMETEYERNAPARRREKMQAMVAQESGDRSLEMGLNAEQMGKFRARCELLVANFGSWDMSDERERIDRIRSACRANAESGGN